MQHTRRRNGESGNRRMGERGSGRGGSPSAKPNACANRVR